jgi:preprotein translocase subunit SecD
VDFTLALACRPADRSFESGLARRARVGQIEDAFPYHLQGANESDKSSKNDADRKISVSCQDAKSLKQVQQTQQLTDAKLEVCQFSWRTLY